MPALFTTAITDGRKTAAFPLHEYWIDIGRLEELERAQAEWNQ
jgi:NDP-sugar pyrophosphorylase family protein